MPRVHPASRQAERPRQDRVARKSPSSSGPKVPAWGGRRPDRRGRRVVAPASESGPGDGVSVSKAQGSALKPARRLCLLNLQQRARPFAICPLVGNGRGPTVAFRGPRRHLPIPNQHEWFQGPLPLAGFRGAKPLGGVRGEAPRLLGFKHSCRHNGARAGRPVPCGRRNSRSRKGGSNTRRSSPSPPGSPVDRSRS